MGHHLFIRDEKAMPMVDLDVALVRHLLIKGATRMGNDQLATLLTRWQYQGPGVWVQIDEKMLAADPHVFEAAAEIARELGDSISVEYLNQNARLPGAVWLKDQRSEDVVEKLRKLQHHLFNGA